MANHPEFSTVDWSALVILGRRGMAVAAGHGASCGSRRRAAPSSRAFGLSETSPTLTCKPNRQQRLHSGTIGLPLPATDIRLLDDDGQEIAHGPARARSPPRARQVMVPATAPF